MQTIALDRLMSQVPATNIKSKKIAGGTVLEFSGIENKEREVRNNDGSTRTQYTDIAVYTSNEGAVRIPLKDLLSFKIEGEGKIYAAEDMGGETKASLAESFTVVSSENRINNDTKKPIYAFWMYEGADTFKDGDDIATVYNSPLKEQYKNAEPTQVYTVKLS